MTPQGRFNTNSPTIKRILKEAAELSASPSADYHAAPLETNIFEWHFTLRGPPEPSPYAKGIYHGRIVLPPTYPLRPPSFRFLTPSGRFEVNREICLSISGHHEETWQPAWGLRTALVALRSFMDGEAKGQVGGVEAGRDVRIRLAEESVSWQCGSCGAKPNSVVMSEVEEEARRCEGDGSSSHDIEIPEELRLGYREEVESRAAAKDEAPSSSETVSTSKLVQTSQRSSTEPPLSNEQPPRSSLRQTIPESLQGLQPGSTSTQLHSPAQRAGAQHSDPMLANQSWIDLAICGIVVALLVMIIRKFL